MRVAKRGIVLAAVGLLAAGLLAACGGNSSKDGLVVFGGEPQNPLIPGMTTENLGGRVVQEVFMGLQKYKADGTPINANAQSIDTSDGKVYKITLKKNWKFHDGTPVKAKNYVDTWNYIADSEHGNANAPFFSAIAGYDDVHPAPVTGSDGKQTTPKPKTDKMSGLQVTGDNSFTVTLSEPFGEFQTRLGYSAFAPLPDSFYKDPKKFGENPIGSGPFKFSSWDHNKQIVLTRNDSYLGPEKPKIKKVTFKAYTKTETAYNDVKSNNLDFEEQIPTGKLTSYKKDFPNQWSDREIGANLSISFPEYDKKFDSPDLHHAVSMAIDRESIDKTIFNNTRTVSDGTVPHSVPGYAKGQCGDFCTYNPDKAKDLLKKAGGFDGTLTISYNADGGHKPWVDATCQSITNTLGIKCEGKPYTGFNQLEQDAAGHKMSGAFYSAWVLDYPSIEDFLSPIILTGGSSNQSGYSSDKVDAALKAADTTLDKDARYKKYQEAERDALQDDMPVVPLWDIKRQSVYSKDIKNVHVTVFGLLDLSTVELK